MSEREAYLGKLGNGVVDAMDPQLVRAFDLADSPIRADLRNPEKLGFKEGMIKLSGDGVFYTLQGEGPSMGEPAVFMRTQICNLRCGWCDTPYTWNPRSEAFWTEPEDVTIDEATQRIQSAWGAQDDRIQKRVIFTGGEPMLQQDKLIQIADRLPDWKVEVETNGTIMPSDELLERAQFNVSPKLGNSDNDPRARIKQAVIQRLNTGNSTFKFVVMQPQELDEIERDYVQGCNIDVEKVILMPQGVTAEEVQQNMQHVAEYAKVKGYRLLGRMQTQIWGARRKV